jgi:hypothetical protein
LWRLGMLFLFLWMMLLMFVLNLLFWFKYRRIKLLFTRHKTRWNYYKVLFNFLSLYTTILYRYRNWCWCWDWERLHRNSLFFVKYLILWSWNWLPKRNRDWFNNRYDRLYDFLLDLLID